MNTTAEAPVNKPIHVTYTNWKKETRTRVIIPLHIWWGHTPWHPIDGWLLHALDPEDEKEKDFALQDCNFTEPPTPCPHP
jgi:hypothetical protein